MSAHIQFPEIFHVERRVRRGDAPATAARRPEGDRPDDGDADAKTFSKPVLHNGRIQSPADLSEPRHRLTFIFAALDALGCTSWIGCEYKPRGDTDAGLAWAKKLGVEL